MKVWLNNLRTPRAALYLLLSSVIVAANTGLVKLILTALQFNEKTADRWAESLRDETLSFVALLVIAAYVDLVVRKGESEKAKKEREAFQDLLQEKLTAAVARRMSNVTAGLKNQLQENLSELRDELRSHFEDVTSEALMSAAENSLRQFESTTALKLALEYSLTHHADRFEHVTSGILGEARESIIDDASLKFTIKSVDGPNGKEFIDISYDFRGKLRKSFYTLMVARGEFKSESRILSGGQVTDAWLILDSDAFASTIRHLDDASIDIKYQDERGNWIIENRPLSLVERHATPSGVLDCKVLKSDLTPPLGLSQCESRIRFTVRLPARPSGLRWFFDNPIFVEEISFDVSQMWPDREMDFTLYPFLVGTEDYTQRAPRRQPVYRIGINDWLSRGHGVMLCWERIDAPRNAAS